MRDPAEAGSEAVDFEDLGLGEDSFDYFGEETEQARAAVGQVEGAEECYQAWLQRIDDMTVMTDERQELWESGLEEASVTAIYEVPGAYDESLHIDLWAASGGRYLAPGTYDANRSFTHWASACYPFHAALEGNTATVRVIEQDALWGVVRVTDDGVDGEVLVVAALETGTAPTEIEISAVSDHAGDEDALVEIISEILGYADEQLRSIEGE